MPIRLLDLEPAANDDEQELVGGLSRNPKQISPKYFYDEIGSKLFEQICEQPEYYPTRTELGIMKQNIGEITELCGPRASVIEFGSGSSLKTRLLLEHLDEPAAYVPVDISRDHLLETAAELAGDYPDIEVLPVRADFTRPFELPRPKVMPERNIVYFPGSTIGNFQNPEAVALLRVMREEARNDGALLIGVDLEKPKDVVEPAYNDAAGVTADFNLNVLRRLNREYDATFDLDAFRHHALFDDDNCRIEMRLISLKRQAIHVAGERFELGEGEYIVTEHSHKYAPEQFAGMAEEAGFSLEQVWTDRDEMFSVQFLVAN